jgi:hypothetical protein
MALLIPGISQCDGPLYRKPPPSRSLIPEDSASPSRGGQRKGRGKRLALLNEPTAPPNGAGRKCPQC